MASAEAIITDKLNVLREELFLKNPLLGLNSGTAELISPLPETPEERDARETARLQAQIQVLEQIKETLTQQHAETKSNFLDIKQRDERSSKQNLWLTFATSGISLILGWLLSLLGSPATLVHAFGR